MKPNFLFVYGILKRGKSADLSLYGAKFVGEAQLDGAQLYHIGQGVGLRLNQQDNGNYQDLGSIVAAHGEVWEIPDELWNWLDKIERNGFCYTRKIVDVFLENVNCDPTLTVWTYEHTYPDFVYDKPVEGNDWKGDY